MQDQHLTVFYNILGVRYLRRNDSFFACHRTVGKWGLEKLSKKRGSKAKAHLRQTCKDIRKCKILIYFNYGYFNSMTIRV